MLEVGGVLVISRPLDGVGSVLGGEVHGVFDLHLIAEILRGLGRSRFGIRKGCRVRPGSLGRSRRAADQRGQHQGGGQSQSDRLFHFSISFVEGMLPYSDFTPNSGRDGCYYTACAALVQCTFFPNYAPHFCIIFLSI